MPRLAWILIGAVVAVGAVWFAMRDRHAAPSKIVSEAAAPETTATRSLFERLDPAKALPGRAEMPVTPATPATTLTGTDSDKVLLHGTLPNRSVVIRNSLRDPVQVVAQKKDTLFLSNGLERVVPYLSYYTARCSALRSILEQGVEVNDDPTRVYCLVPVAHTCGNDPIREQVERVNLADLIGGIGDAGGARVIAEPEEAFRDGVGQTGALTASVFYYLVTRCGITWDEQSDVEFP